MGATLAIEQERGAGGPRHLALSPDADPVAVLLSIAAELASEDPCAAVTSAAHALAMLHARAAAEDPARGLSPAEERVARQAAAGAPNRQIAERLYLSVRTVECHLSHVYAKLGVRSKAELAAIWVA